MTTTTFRHLLPAVALGLAAGGAVGQDASAPSDPHLQYRSAFDGYLPHADPPALGWRGANELVRRLGGHAGHLRGQGPTPGRDDRPLRTEPPSHPGAPTHHRPPGVHGDAR